MPAAGDGMAAGLLYVTMTTFRKSFLAPPPRHRHSFYVAT